VLANYFMKKLVLHPGKRLGTLPEPLPEARI
jgi:hypothetical protein